MAESGRQTDDSNDSDSESEEKLKNHRLTRFLGCLLENNVKFKIPETEVRDIKAAIHNMVSEVVCLVSSSVPWLESSRLIEVGSMAEGTSIIKPDEFDFIVVLEQKGVEIHRVCEGRRGYAHVKVTDRERHYQWSKWLKDGYLCGKIGVDFLPLNALKELIPQSYFRTLSDAYRHEFAMAIMRRGEGIKQKTKRGIMSVDNFVQCHGPAFMPKFKWKSFRPGGDLIITVDVIVAIEVALTPDIVTLDDVNDIYFLQKVQNHGKFMLVPCKQKSSCVDSLCLRLTFTEIEVELVTELSQHHKDCYMLLKYLFGGKDGYTFFPSYAWKTLLLIHSRVCHENENLAKCVKTLIAACLHYLFNREDPEETIDAGRIVRLFMPGKKFLLNIPSLFLKDHNILDTKDYMIPCEQFLNQIEVMLDSLEVISKSDGDAVDPKVLTVANSLATGARAYAKSVPCSISRNSILTLVHCMRYYQDYFSGRY